MGGQPEQPAGQRRHPPHQRRLAHLGRVSRLQFIYSDGNPHLGFLQGFRSQQCRGLPGNGRHRHRDPGLHQHRIIVGRIASVPERDRHPFDWNRHADSLRRRHPGHPQFDRRRPAPHAWHQQWQGVRVGREHLRPAGQQRNLRRSHACCGVHAGCSFRQKHHSHRRGLRSQSRPRLHGDPLLLGPRRKRPARPRDHHRRLGTRPGYHDRRARRRHHHRRGRRRQPLLCS